MTEQWSESIKWLTEEDDEFEHEIGCCIDDEGRIVFASGMVGHIDFAMHETDLRGDRLAQLRDLLAKAEKAQGIFFIEKASLSTRAREMLISEDFQEGIWKNSDFFEEGDLLAIEEMRAAGLLREIAGYWEVSPEYCITSTP